MRTSFLLLVPLVAGCEVRSDEQKRLDRLDRDRERLAAAAAAREEEERSRPPPAPGSTTPRLTEADKRAEEEALKKAKAADDADLKKLHDAFPAKVKKQAGCTSVVIEANETLRAEGCSSFYPPAASPALFEEAKTLGFRLIHNRSVGKAWCSYYLSNYPQQKLWKCNNAGGSWPGP